MALNQVALHANDVVRFLEPGTQLIVQVAAGRGKERLTPCPSCPFRQAPVGEALFRRQFAFGLVIWRTYGNHEEWHATLLRGSGNIDRAAPADGIQAICDDNQYIRPPRILLGEFSVEHAIS